MRVATILRISFVIFLALFVSITTVMAEVTLDLYPDDIQKIENPVKVIFNGEIYKESWWFDEVLSKKYSAGPDEKFIIKVFEVNQRGSLAERLNLWSSDERADIKATFSDPLVLSGSRGYLKKIKRAAFLAKVTYGPYVIFLIQYSSPELGNEIDEYVITEVDGTYYMTNKLKADPVFVYLGQVLKKRLTLKNGK